MVLHRPTATYFSFNSSWASMKLGRWLFEHPGVKAPGTAKIATYDITSIDQNHGADVSSLDSLGLARFRVEIILVPSFP